MGFLDNLLKSTREKVYNSQFAQNLRQKWNAPTTQEEHPWLSGANSFLQGMSSGVVGGTGVDKYVADKVGFDSFNNFQAQSPLDKLLKGAGYFTGMVSSPLTRAMNKGGFTQNVISTTKNMGAGSLFGGLASTAGNLISGEDITLQNTLEGAAQGAKYSWLYPYTSSATDKAMVAAANKFPSVAKYLAPVTEEGLRTAQQMMTTAGAQGARAFAPKAASFLAKNVVRQAAESPVETAAFAGMDTLNNDQSYGQNFGNRFLSDLLGNIAFGGVTGGFKVGKAGYDGINSFAPKTPMKPNPEYGRASDAPKEVPMTPEEVSRDGQRKIFKTAQEMLQSKEYAQEEARIAREKEKVSELTGLNPNKVEELYKTGAKAEDIVREVRKSQATPIGDILAKRRYSVSNEPQVKSDTEMQSDYRRKELISKTGLSEKFVDQKLSEGYSPDKIYSAYSYAKESTKPVKSLEGYISKALQTNNFSQPAVKPVQKEDAGYLESLLQSEKPAKPEILPEVKPAEQPVVAELPKTETGNGYKYDKTRVGRDIELLGRVATKVNSPETKKQALKFVESFGSGLDAELSARGVKFADFVDQYEAGKVDPSLKDLADATKKFFDTMANVGAERNKQFPMERQNYFRHVNEDMIANTKDRTMGDILFSASYTKERTGKLTDYIKDARALVNYAEEAIGPVSKEEQARVRIANEITSEVKEQVDKEAAKTDNRTLFEKKADQATKSVSITRKIKDAQAKGDIPTPETRVEYDAPDRKWFARTLERALTSTNELADRAGSKFYDSFLLPFRQVASRVNNYSTAVSKLNEAQLKAEYQKRMGRPAKDMTSEEMVSRLTFNMHRTLTARATDVFTKNVESADFKQPYLQELADQIFNEYVVTDIKVPKTAEKVMGFIRAQTGRGALGLNVASAANNILEIRRIIASVDHKSFEEGMRRVNKGENFTKKYGVDSTRSTALERMYQQRSKVSKAMEKVDEGLFYMFDKSENYKDNIMLAALEEQGKKKGLTGRELEKFVFKKFDQYAIKYGKGNDIGLFQNKVVKTIFQFAQYPIKDIVLFGNKTASALSGDKGDRKYLVKYALSSIAQMLAFKATMGVIGFGDKSGTPYDLVEDIKNGRVPFSPIVSLAWQLGQNAVGAVSGEDTSSYEYEKRQNEIKRNAMITTVPASNQLFNKTGAYLDARNKGYYETKYGKNKGSVANPVGTGVGDTVKGTLFGPSYDSKRQAYFDEYEKGGSPALTKNESAVYKTLPESEKAGFYDKSLARDKQYKSLEKMKEQKEPGFLDRILGKKEAEVDFPVPTKDSLPQEWKDFRSDYDTRVSMGYEPTPEETKARYFQDKTGNTKDLKEKVAVYKTIDSVLDNEDMPDYVKDQVMKASGASADDIAYYRSASEADQTRLQELLPIIDKLEHGKALELLMKSRKAVADKVLVTDGMVDYLYENDHISEDEKELLKAIKYDEINGEFYIKKAFAKKGEGKKLTYAQASKLFKFDNLAPKTTNAISKLLATNTSTSSNNRLVQEILGSGYTPKLSGKKLWFKPY